MTTDVLYRCTLCHLEQTPPINTCKCGGQGFDRIAATLRSPKTRKAYSLRVPSRVQPIIGRDDPE